MKIFEYRCLNNSDKCTMSNMRLSYGWYYNYSDSSIGDNFKSALKIPSAGSRDGTDRWRYYGNNQGETAAFWSSSPGDDKYSMGASCLYLSSFCAFIQNRNSRTYGESVRCFKNYNVESSVSYNFDYKTLITILIPFLIG